ncbi:MAG: calcium/sodium antiporter [Gammaproteobacteria bacterium]|nr:calcium/sodium antiporter [Gammaproteobacteria bacterium]
MSNEILLSILGVLGGFVLLVWGADRFVHGAAATARNLGISPLIIGLTIVGMGTSAPEILVSAVAAWQGNPALGVGNALGSNIANIALVLGATALVMPLAVQSETLRREYPVMFIIMLVALLLVSDGHLGREDGIILLTGLIIMLFWMVSLGRRQAFDPMETEYEQGIPLISTGKALMWLAVGMVVLLVSSRILVWGSINIAQFMGISDLVIGLTIVAIGTSMPELAASMMSAWKKEPDIAIGNIIGSNMFNLLAVLGIPGLIQPHTLDAEVLTRDFPWMIGLSIALFAAAYGFRGESRINRLEGGLLLIAYVVYLTVLYFDVTG